MPNIASILKAEISRVARKEMRIETEGLKKTVAVQRSEIVALKRRIQEMEKALKSLAKSAASTKVSAKADADSGGDGAEGGSFRFRAKGMASNRKRLGLSAEEFGLLVGASGQSVYGWEAGKSVPRTKNLAAIAALRGVGKKEVAARLATLKSQG
jgi:DNA-binding transcriptional regulator YiaG